MKILELAKKICYTINAKICMKRRNEKVDVINLSNHVISEFEKKGSPITNLKLQKVLYYVQGYFIREFGEEAFTDDIYCWQYGPVVPSVYYEYSFNGACALHSNENFKLNIDEVKEQLIAKIVEKCRHICSSALVNMTHSESPWKNANPGCIIKKQEIRTFFTFNDPLEIRK